MDKKIIEHFKKVDSQLHALIAKIETLEQWHRKHHLDYFIELCGNIIGQQLSGKAADTIFARFEKLFDGKKISPENVLNIPDQKLRDVGMSWSKVKYVKDLAQKISDNELKLEELDNLKDEEVIKSLTKVKGIGPWTAEMFLMFTLGREDVFSHGDLGLKNAMKKLYKLKKEPARKQIEKIVEKWKPYRSYASRILWKSLEIK
jgi:DNA-3-methyladenine glycosylase II